MVSMPPARRDREGQVTRRGQAAQALWPFSPLTICSSHSAIRMRKVGDVYVGLFRGIGLARPSHGSREMLNGAATRLRKHKGQKRMNDAACGGPSHREAES